jgi:hypothetical protein
MRQILASVPTLWLLALVGISLGCSREESPPSATVETAPIPSPPEPGPPPPPPIPVPETPADLAQPLHLQEEMVVVRQDSAVGTLKDVSGTNTLTVRAARFNSPDSAEIEYVVTVDLGAASEAFLTPEQAENLAKALDSVCTAQPVAPSFPSFRATYRSASDLTVICSDGHDEPDHRAHACRIEIAGGSFATTTNGLHTLKSLLQEATHKLKEAQK